MMDNLEEHEIGRARLSRSITVRATETHIFYEHCIRLSFCFAGYGEEHYTCIAQIPIDQYKMMKDCGEIGKGIDFTEYVARYCYNHIERSEIGKDVHYDDVYKVVKDCLEYYVWERKMNGVE